jgi:hypothetical protein
LREMNITQDGFAANAETGLRPLLEGRDVKEVPIAWINRSADMGVSTFRVARVAPGYAMALARMLRGYYRSNAQGIGRMPKARSTTISPAIDHPGDPQTESSEGELSWSCQER